MTARWQPPLLAPPGADFDPPQPAGLKEHLNLFLDNRWLIAAITAAALSLGLGYALLGPRVYEANVLIQVEDAERGGGNFPGDANGNTLTAKTPTSGEAEILKSRAVLGQAIDNTRLFITASPHYIPLLGAFMARYANGLSTPGVAGFGNYVSGAERISVPQMDVPATLEGTRFLLIAGSNGTYTLTHPKLATPLHGMAGVPLDADTHAGRLHLLVASFDARPGGAFELVRKSKQLTLLGLQNDLRVVERGKQSGVIDVSWQAGDREQLTDLLNEVARLYVRQNIDQKTAQAERAVSFLGSELPKLKEQLEQSEDTYNQYRNQNGTISLDDEARNALSQNVDLQAKLLDARQKRLELSGRLTNLHPSVVTVDAQIASLKKELGAVDSRIRRMPMLQQNSLRMQRDIKVNTDLYASLLNSSLQMRLAREGRIGNVHVLDAAMLPEKPIRPKGVIVMALALAVGLFLSGTAALLRKSLKSTIASPSEIEVRTGLDVYSSIPMSHRQRLLDRAVAKGKPGIKVLAALHLDDPALEGLRRLRTALKFAMLGAPNNRIMITSATPGAGKSFVSSNFATLLATSGKRVLLIDADLRRGNLAGHFGLPRKNGLADVVADGMPFERAIHHQVLPQLDVMTAGRPTADPTSLMTCDALAQALAMLSARYDAVVVDAPPALLASETAAIARGMGTVLLVARAGANEMGELLESAKRLAHVGAAFHGVVFNAVDVTQRRYGSYDYGYGSYRFRESAYGIEGPETVVPKRIEPEHAPS